MSPRQLFQTKYFALCPTNSESPRFLNIGCADDPLKFGDRAMHVDLDDWSYLHKHFTQADAEKLPFKDQEYHTVVMGDIIEHLLNPEAAIREAARVCSDTVVMTIFEEWRLSGPGQHIEEAQELSEIESKRLGYESAEDYQQKEFPKRIGVPDEIHPHLVHINQFEDTDIIKMANCMHECGFLMVEFAKVTETYYEPDDHYVMNWLLSFRRVP